MLLKLGFIFFALAASVEPWQEELQKIESQIAELEGMQDKLNSQVQRNVNNAMRWQFQNNQYLEARQAWEQAALQKEKLKKIQIYLDKLNQRKRTILQEHGK